MSPTMFWAMMSRKKEVLKNEPFLHSEGISAHKYTDLSVQTPRESLETMSNWRQRYPYLAHLHAIGDLNCDIIHMEVSLDMSSHDTDGAELLTRQEMSIPSKEFSKCAWQCVTSVIKPAELYRDPIDDPPIEGQVQTMLVAGVSDAETRLRVPFPVIAFAQAFASLAQIDFDNQKKRNAQPYTNEHSRSIRDYVNQISMYQELQSSAAPGMPFIRRGVIIWSFHKMRTGEGNGTTWRYVDPPPARRMCMSPTPTSHQGFASMTESYNSWPESPLNLQSNIHDSFIQGLATPPLTGDLESPFPNSNYVYPTQPFGDMPQESLSFGSSITVDSESTLVGHDPHGPSSQLDNFLSNANASLNDYDHSSQGWHLPHGTENFDADTAWNYIAPSSTPQLPWDQDTHTNPKSQHNGWGSEAVSPNKQNISSWPESLATPDQKAHSNNLWMDIITPSKPHHAWPEVLATPDQKSHSNIVEEWPEVQATPENNKVLHEGWQETQATPETAKVNAAWLESSHITLTPSLDDVGKERHWTQTSPSLDKSLDGWENKHDWAENVLISSPAKSGLEGGGGGYLENSIEQKLLNWSQQHRGETEVQGSAVELNIDDSMNLDIHIAGSLLEKRATKEEGWEAVSHGDIIGGDIREIDGTGAGGGLEAGGYDFEVLVRATKEQ